MARQYVGYLPLIQAVQCRVSMLKKFIVRFLLIFVLLSSCIYGFFLNIGSWLTTTDVPGKADVIICLDGSDDRINKAVLLLGEGLAEKVAVTTDTAYQAMLKRKVSPDKILKADWSAKTTYEEGLLLKTILDENVKSALLVTDPFHLFRAKWTFLHLFSGKLITFSFVSSDAPSLQGFWWSNHNSRLFVLNELPKIVYYWVWHGVLGIVDDPQWAVDLEKSYMAMIRRL
ncbi:MAG: YdcF family protein [Pseudomonadota bacterium]